MGNVLASSAPPRTGLGTISPPLPSPPIQPASSTSTGANATESSAENKSEQQDFSLEPNPGYLEELHKKCKDVFPQCFEGGKILISKGLSNHFQISHTLSLSTVSSSGYKFGSTFVGANTFGPGEFSPVLFGDIDPSGNVTANVVHHFNAATRCKFAAQIQNSKFAAAQFTGDYRGKDYTASLTLGNLDIIGETGVIMAQYLQNVMPKLSLGTELVYQFAPQIPGGQMAIVSLASRYTGSNFVASGTLGGTGLHACYYHKASEQLQVGVEVDTNIRMTESVTSIGYQVDLPKANLVFRGMLDSNWTVSAVLEKKLLPLPFTFALSGVVNHQKNQCRVGMGLFIG